MPIFRPRARHFPVVSRPGPAAYRLTHGHSWRRCPLEIIARMLAGGLGRGTAPISAGLRPLVERAVVDAGSFTIRCFPVSPPRTPTASVSHSMIPSAPPALPDRLSALGVPDGPGRKVLAAGERIDAVGRQDDHPEDFLGPARKAKNPRRRSATLKPRMDCPTVRNADLFGDRGDFSRSRFGDHATTAISPG